MFNYSKDITGREEMTTEKNSSMDWGFIRMVVGIVGFVIFMAIVDINTVPRAEKMSYQEWAVAVEESRQETLQYKREEAAALAEAAAVMARSNSNNKKNVK